MTEFKDYYKILGLDDDADAAAIKQAYRRLARKYHPDVSQEPDAEARFKEIGEAYEALKDPERRKQYDELKRYGWRGGDSFQPPPGWSGGGGGFGAEGLSGFGDFFDMLFGGIGPRTSAQTSFGRQGRDLNAQVRVDLETAVSGGVRRLNIGSKTLNVTIPKGVADGQRIRLTGQGEPGVGGGQPGDLYLDIQIQPHRRYRLEGRDLLIDCPIAPWEAALGCQLTVPTPTGAVSVKIPEGSSSHQRLRLKGRGLPAQGSHAQGDAYVVLKIKLPKQLSEAERALYESLRETSQFDPRSEQ